MASDVDLEHKEKPLITYKNKKHKIHLDAAAARPRRASIKDGPDVTSDRSRRTSIKDDLDVTSERSRRASIKDEPDVTSERLRTASIKNAASVRPRKIAVKGDFKAAKDEQDSETERPKRTAAKEAEKQLSKKDPYEFSSDSDFVQKR